MYKRQVNAVAPGFIATDMTAVLPEAVQAEMTKGIPLGRFGDPKTDIAPVAVFLASDMASYVSGETITIQGGSGLRP